MPFSPIRSPNTPVNTLILACRYKKERKLNGQTHSNSPNLAQGTTEANGAEVPPAPRALEPISLEVPPQGAR
jgi:hypothetical protein